MQREIVTIQVGGIANHVGTHWWNLQEAGFIYDPALIALKEVENDILFRQGLTIKGEETYTPRLLLFDVTSSLPSLTEQGVKYGAGVTWTGTVEKIERELPNISSDNGDTSNETVTPMGEYLIMISRIPINIVIYRYNRG